MTSSTPPAEPNKIALPVDHKPWLNASPINSMCAIIKTHTVYATPWWRPLGLDGQPISADLPVGVVFDNSPAE